MLPLLIESTESYAGKSLVCLGLGLSLCFRPFRGCFRAFHFIRDFRGRLWFRCRVARRTDRDAGCG